MSLGNHIVDVLELGDSNNRTKDFFLHNLHAFLDISENGRLNEVALVTKTFAAHVASGTFLLAGFDVSHDTVKLDLRYLRALEGVRIEGIADLGLGCVFLEPFEELVINALYAAV